jgi:hypothetical protein
MLTRFTCKSRMAHYLIGYEPRDPNAPHLEEHLKTLSARRVSSCEWVLRAEPGKTLEFYRTIGRWEVRGFFAQQLSEGYDWHKIAFQADTFLSRLKVS